ncbi:MAG: hypothetical protein KDD69_10945 [Bdellovibrionales bacterium]|nr:hypothetical protein [Bdellovibrionales bacterium]
MRHTLQSLSSDFIVRLIPLFAVAGLGIYPPSPALADGPAIEPRWIESPWAEPSGHDGTIAQTPNFDECPYFDVEIRNLPGGGVVRDPHQLYGAAAELSCIDEMLARAYENSDVGPKRYADDNFAFKLVYQLIGDPDHSVGLQSNGAYCHETKVQHATPGGRKQGENCLKLSVAMDSSCEVVPLEEAIEECGEAFALGVEVTYQRSTPISLIWEPGYDIESQQTIVRFPLEPGTSKEWCVWKGSKQSPLLVIDSNGSGRISSAYQLFGRWAFGGQQSASLDSNSHQLQPRPWNHGYEALASLDRDGNGRVEQDELRGLALWFDENSDAVSQPGEVRTLESVGVTALFYKPDQSTAEPRLLFAGKGYEREVNGTITVGASVDWEGEIATTAAELTMLPEVLPRNTPAIEQLPASDEQPPSEAKPVLGASRINGIWKVQMGSPTDSHPAAASGYLILNSNDESARLEGSSVSTQPFQHQKLQSKSLAMLTTFEGIVRSDQTGQINYEWSTKSGKTRLRSVARLAADGALLIGETEVAYQIDGSGRRMRYQWYARPTK